MIARIFANQVFRFLLLGGLAAAINWAVRFPLSLVLPIGPAVAVAYLIGMSVGFWLYRTYVFPGSSRPISSVPPSIIRAPAYSTATWATTPSSSIAGKNTDDSFCA